MPKYVTFTKTTASGSELKPPANPDDKKGKWKAAQYLQPILPPGI